MLEGYEIKDVRNYSAEELRQLTTVIDAELQERVTSKPSLYLIGRYLVAFKREKRNYFLEIYKSAEGSIWWSYGENKFPVLGLSISNITKKSIDFMLLDSMLHTSPKRGTPIEANPANIVTNYLDLVTRILNDIRVH